MSNKRPQDSPTPVERKKPSTVTEKTKEEIDPAWKLPEKLDVVLPQQTLPVLEISHRSFYDADGEMKIRPYNKKANSLEFRELVRVGPEVIIFGSSTLASVYLNRRVPDKHHKREPLYVRLVECSIRPGYELKEVSDQYNRTKINVPISVPRSGELVDNLENLRSYVEAVAYCKDMKSSVRPLLKPNTSRDEKEVALYDLMWCKWPTKNPMKVTVDGVDYRMTPEDFNQYCLGCWHDYIVEIGAWGLKTDNQCSIGWTFTINHVNVRRPENRKVEKISLVPTN